MRCAFRAQISADPRLVNEFAPLGDALIVLSRDEAEELRAHRQREQHFLAAALPRGAVLPYFRDSTHATPTPEADSGLGEAALPEDDTGWDWLQEEEGRSLVIRASSANALDTILRLVEAEDPAAYRSSEPLLLDEENLGLAAEDAAESEEQEEEQEEEEEREEQEKEEVVVVEELAHELASVMVVQCGVGAVTMSDVAAAAEHRCDVWCFSPDDGLGIAQAERGGVTPEAAAAAQGSGVELRGFRLLPEVK